jgi:hypothetical protein
MTSSIIKKANARLILKGDLRLWSLHITNHTKSIQVTQNKLIRCVLNLGYRSHIDNEHFKILNWLPIQKRVDQIIPCNVFKIKHELAPEYMGENFIPLDSVHTNRTKSSENGCYIHPSVRPGEHSMVYDLHSVHYFS